VVEEHVHEDGSDEFFCDDAFEHVLPGISFKGLDCVRKVNIRKRKM
jgi:hypothetical protein